ncbi:serine/threonine-protein kinase PLK4-like [Argiope bruennichi]|uniref:serine/threonine-protein kinase PLK4-like n=1 Tax=Argiope bruennichi TaxID=94029 RepID=UPI0024951283|nr:serine/threonine-protein kinase PLK4-like [Argiope bruennichi]
MENFKKIKKIGEGGFADVYEAKYLGEERCFKDHVAIKIINKNSATWRQHEKFVRQEIEIHKGLQHDNIVKLHQYFEDRNTISLVLELCSNGSLHDFMKKRKHPFDEYDAYKTFKQIVDGVMYLHSKCIIHRDLTLRNILLTKDMKVKIADFGLSTDSIQPDIKKYTVVGTPNYMPPEIRKNKGYGDKVDCWYLGCILYALLVGKPPKDLNKIDYPEDIKRDARELLKALLTKNPTNRICIEAVPESQFFKKYERNKSETEDSGNGSRNYISSPTERESHLRSHDSGFNSRNSAQAWSRKKSYSAEKLTERPNFDLLKDKLKPLPSRRKDFLSYDNHAHYRERSASEDRKSYKPLSYNNALQPAYSNSRERSASAERERLENLKICYHHDYENTYHINSRSQERCKSNDCVNNSSWKTHQNCNPEPTQHCNDPSCRFSNTLLESHPKVYPSTCSHVGLCDTKCSHIGSCCCHSHSYQKHPISNGNNTENPEKFSEHTLERQTSPLNAARLRPKRHMIKELNTVLHISTDQQVIVEVLKTKKEKMFVTEVFIISTDGMKIKMFKPPKNTPLDDNHPPPLPDDPKEIKHYNYQNFLKTYWRRYLLAKKFVDTLRAKTPKLINNGENAKFYVMENSPDPVFRMDFYDGGSVVKKGNKIYITKFEKKCVISDPEYLDKNFNDKFDRKCVVSDPKYLDKDFNSMLEEFQIEKENCEKIVAFHESLKIPNFPIVIGMVKNDLICSEQKARKENIAPPASGNNKRNWR